MKSRILQLIGLIVLCIIGVVFFKGCSEPTVESDTLQYLPPSP